MIRVLQIIDGKSYGGIVKVMYDLSCTCDGVKMDFLTQIPICDFAYSLNCERKNLIKKIKYNYRLYKYLKNNKYDIIHINSGVFLFSFQVTLIAKLAGAKKIVVHSHSIKDVKGFRKIMMIMFNPLYRSMSDYYLSCSNEAVFSLFTSNKGVYILKNGIDVNKYKYRENMRNKYRKELGIGNEKVYGHIGRFHELKNHKFIIDLFNNISKKEKNSILVLVGEGKLKDEIYKYVSDLALSDRVIFLGFRKDVHNLLNVFDVFLLPSLYEGLPLSVVESLTNGLPSFVSKNVTDDLNISSNYHKIDSFDINVWTKELLNIKIKDRKNAYLDTVSNGYDIKDVAKELTKIYKGLIK